MQTESDNIAAIILQYCKCKLDLAILLQAFCNVTNVILDWEDCCNVSAILQKKLQYCNVPLMLQQGSVL